MSIMLRWVRENFENGLKSCVLSGGIHMRDISKIQVQNKKLVYIIHAKNILPVY